jgi:alpha-L-rhamnosidase
VTEGGRPATQSAGLKFLRMDGGAAVFDAASGSYRFEAKGFVPVKAVR